jgi:excisionase family DNA binding protein
LETYSILTVREVAEFLRVSPDTVRRFLRQGALPGRKIGPRQWRIRRDDVDAFWRRGAPPAVPDTGEG